MSDIKFKTTEEAAASVAKAFERFGLTAEGELPNKEEKINSNLGDSIEKLTLDNDLIKSEEIKEEISSKETNKEIKSQEFNSKNELEELKRIIAETRDLVKQEREEKVNNLKLQLENEKNLAISKGDHAKVAEIDNKVKQLPVSNNLPAPIKDFCERHKDWFGVDNNLQALDMTAYTKQQDAELYMLKLPLKQHMELLEKRVKEKYSTYFDQVAQKEDNVQSVEGGNRKGIVKNQKKVYTVDKLSAEAKFIAKEFARMKILPTDKYIEALNKDGVLE